MANTVDCNILDLLEDVETHSFSPKEFYERYIKDYQMQSGDITSIFQNLDALTKKKRNNGKKELVMLNIVNGQDVVLKFGEIGKFDMNIRRFTFMMYMVAFDNGLDLLSLFEALGSRLRVNGVELCYWKYPMEACVGVMAEHQFSNARNATKQHRRVLTTLLNQKNEQGVNNVKDYISSHVDDISAKVAAIKNLEIEKIASKNMRGISVTRFGTPSVLRLSKNLLQPLPKASQVLINVKAAGVNPVDTYIRNGTHIVKPELPYIPGKDGAGIVQQIGQNVTKFKEGDRVWFSSSKTGSYAEFCLCEEGTIGKLPDDLSFEDGAMLGIPYRTAFRALFQKCKLREGETVLIHGATGGVGVAAIQLCKLQGANIIATAGSEDGERMLRSIGVTTIYNHRSEGYMKRIKANESNIDIILEMLADVNLTEDLKVIGQNGKIVVIGCRGSIEINPRLIMGSEANVIGCALLTSTADQVEEQMSYIQQRLDVNYLKPILWKTLDLYDARKAHKEIIENKGTKGQIVLTVA